MPRRRRVTRSHLTDLELPADEMRAMLELAARRLVEHVVSLPAQPMHGTAGALKLAASLREPLPEQGRSFEALLGQILGRIVPASLNTASPGYLAYIPSGGLFPSALADLITAATNRYAGVWAAGPGLAAVEATVVDWCRTLVGLPATGGGVLTSGGSMANLVATVAARRALLGDRIADGVVYTSDQAHHSVAKAALVAGLPLAQVREVPTDERFRMEIPALRERLARDRAAGLRPFLVVASAGTTATGAIDPLPALADVCDEHGLWLHVDAAYGGFFALTGRGRERLAGIERARSVTLDPHKGLFVPYGTGCLVVRDVEELRAAFRLTSSYMPPEGAYDAADLSPELSREARGLRVWLPLKLYGADVFRRALDEKLDLAAHAARRLATVPHLRLEAPPELSLLAFRLAPPGRDEAALDRLNQALLSAVNASQRVFLSGVRARGQMMVRLCVLSFRTHQERLDEALDLIAHHASGLMNQEEPGADIL